MASAATQPFGEVGACGIGAGFRLQRQMLEVFSDISREWLTRATSEAELAFKLPNKLTAARSLPDVFSAYQEWLGEWMHMFGEDSRRIVADGRKIIDAGVRCFTEAAPASAN